jgi:hypothetical protein
VVIVGEVVISVANIDLIYLGMNLTLTSVETANRARLQPRPCAQAASSQEGA